MINKLKNWWATILYAAVLILDMGFDVFSPLLDALHVSEGTMNIVKIVFGIAVLVKQKLAVPTKDPEKLQKIVDRQVELSDGNGTVQPDKGL